MQRVDIRNDNLFLVKNVLKRKGNKGSVWRKGWSERKSWLGTDLLQRPANIFLRDASQYQ
jgi:hypothetical protein